MSFAKIEIDLPDEDFKKLKYLCRLEKIPLKEKIKEVVMAVINAIEIHNF